MNMQKIQRMLRAALCALLALYMLSALQMDVSPMQWGEEKTLAQAIAAGFKKPVYMSLMLYALLAALTGRVLGRGRENAWQRICAMGAAVFLAGCMLVGRAWIDPQWGNLVIKKDMRCMTKWLFALPGWLLFFYLGVTALYRGMDAVSRRTEKPGENKRHGLLAWFDAHPFAAPLAVLLVCYLPVTVLSLPGLVESGDTVSQIVQFYGGIPGGHTRIYADSMLTNHHPILHTLLLYVFLELGRVFLGDAQIGLGILTCLQVLATAGVLAYALSTLKKEGVPAGVCLLAALFFGLHPRIQNMIVLVSKDMLYADALVLLGVSLIGIIRHGKGLALLLASAAGCMLMRNEGIYMLLGTFAAAFVLVKRSRHMAAAGMVFCAVLWIIWTGVVFPALHISPGSEREMFSIPFQQTGRVVAYSGESVTPQEREAIDGVLNYALVGERYQPNLADGVKNLYRDHHEEGAMGRYLKTWFAMLLKHPMTYAEAFLDNKNLYLYPTASEIGIEHTAKRYATSELDLQVITRDCEQYGIALSYPQALHSARLAYEQAREGLFALPGLRLFTQSAAVVWAVALLLLYVLSRKKGAEIVLLVPVVLQVLVTLIGPTDGNLFRYLYPVLLYSPLPCLHALYAKRGQG